jgi:predicted GNAT family N-acyltransferase
MTIHVRVADYETDEAALRAVRFTVFVDEQKVPAEMEMDDDDPRCIHVLALDDDVPVGTGRLDVTRAGKVGRVAVLASRRGQRIGTMIMESIHEAAGEHGLAAVWCNAQVSAVPFYEGLGYRVTSTEPFDEAGIPHLRMELAL